MPRMSKASQASRTPSSTANDPSPLVNEVIAAPSTIKKHTRSTRKATDGTSSPLGPTTNELSPDQVNRLWEHALHQDEMVGNRVYLFLVFESVLLGVVGVLYSRPTPSKFVLVALTILGLTLTIILDTKNYVVHIERVYQGSVNMSVVRAAEVFRAAVSRNTPSVIVVHNHPSGDPTPSPEDAPQLMRYLIGFNASGYFINPDLLALAQGAA